MDFFKKEGEEVSQSRLSVVIPAFNEEENILELIKRVKAVVGEDAEIIVVDDCSTDRTPEILKDAGVRTIRHPYNKGNGSAVKTGLRAAGGEMVVLMDGDGQHRPEDIPQLLAHLVDYDMVIGARTRDSEANYHRRIYNRLVSVFATYITGIRIPDLTSGFRAMRASIAKKFIYLLPNTFSYPVTITLSMIKAGYSVKFVTLKFDQRLGKSKINLLTDGSRFLVILLRVATLFSPMKVFLPVSLFCFFGGVIYYLYTFFMYHRFTNLALFLFLVGVIIFLLGLIAEVVSQLRLDRSEG